MDGIFVIMLLLLLLYFSSIFEVILSVQQNETWCLRLITVASFLSATLVHMLMDMCPVFLMEHLLPFLPGNVDHGCLLLPVTPIAVGITCTFHICFSYYTFVFQIFFFRFIFQQRPRYSSVLRHDVRFFVWVVLPELTGSRAQELNYPDLF